MRNGFSKFSKALSRPSTALIFSALLLYPQAINANGPGPVSPQVFTRGSNVYVVDHQRIVFLSMDTRSSHTLYNSVDSVFNIVSAARSGDVIWASNKMGAVIAVNMQTGTVEEFGRGRVGGGGWVDIDRRFVWVASGDTLCRMDLTSREWVSLPIPKSGGEVRGLISFNDQVHVVSASAVHVLTTASEDWVVVPHNGFALSPGDFRRVDDAAYITQDRALYRYDPAKRLWSKAEVRGRMRAASLSPELLAVATENRFYMFNSRSFTLEPQPALPMLRGIRAIAAHNGRPVCAVDGLLVMSAASPFDVGVAVYPDYLSIDRGASVFSYYDHIILYMGDRFAIYNPARKLWSGVKVVIRGGERKGQRWWDENGASFNLTDEHQSSLGGTVTLKQFPTVSSSEEDGLVLDPGITFADAAVNVHTADQSGRFLDITIDKAATTTPPEKGFYYRGLEGDIIERASFGVQGSGIAAGQATPGVLAEGGAAVFSGKARVENRDRAFLTAAAGGGHVLSRTEWRTFGYERSGVYRLQTDADREIMGSSVKVYVDGAPLPETDFIYDQGAGAVRLLRRDKSDPTSVIQVSFSERVFPEDRYALEPFPENHFGQYGFAEGAISPRSWLSARAGVMAFADRPGLESGAMVFTGAPVELRGGANRSFLLLPEIAYDARMGSHSAGVSAGVRENRAFGSYRGFWTEPDFYGIDRYKNTFAYRGVNSEHELNVGYDLRDDLRADWRQLHRRTEDGGLSHFELRSLYSGSGGILPDAEVAVSGRILENGPDAAIDPGRESHKESFTLRLSDLSSAYLSRTNYLHSAGYDFSWTEYLNGPGQRGRTVYGLASISPVSALTLTGTGTYRLNPSGIDVRKELNPTLAVNTRDLPRGFDVNAVYSAYVSEFAGGNSDVAAGVNFFGYFYPGEYTDALDKIALYWGYVNEMESHVPGSMSNMKAALFSDGFAFRQVVAEEAGILFFPMENLLLSSYNSRYRDFTYSAAYTSRERAKLWLENGDGLEANIIFYENAMARDISADALYERRWAGGLLAGAGLFGSHSESRKDEDESAGARVGPRFIMSLVRDLSGFVRNIENSHSLQVAFNPNRPDVEYMLYLRLKMPPNISLVAELQIAVEGMRTVWGSGGLYLYAGF